MADGQSISATGISETRQGEGVLFRVLQHKNAQLKTSLKMLGATVGVAFISNIIMVAAGAGGPAGFALVILSVVALMACMVAGAAFLLGTILILLSMPQRLGAAEFEVGRSSVKLNVKQRPNYPDRIEREHIQALYLKQGKRVAQYGDTHLATEPAGIVSTNEAVNTAMSLGKGLGVLMGSQLAKTSWSVAITAYGQEVLLATWLTESQASYLMHRVERAFAG